MARLSRALLAFAWLVATVSVPCAAFGRAFNVGFAAAIALALTAACCNRRTLWSALPTRALLAAFGLAVLAYAVPSLAQGLSARAFVSAGRGCAVFAWFILMVLALGDPRAKRALVLAGAALLVGNLLFAGCSLLIPGHFSSFERVRHEYVAGFPRFRGFANSPAPAGVWALVSIGLMESSPRSRDRWFARALGQLEAAATLSIALLALPGLLAALLPRRWLRRTLVGASVVLAAAILYFQPLELTVAGRALTLSRELPEYWSEGLGPQYMPQVTIALPGIIVRGHVSAYGKLALRGLSCFAQHPLLGVGPGGFRDSCRVMAMNTFGEWTDQRDSHNQIGGLLAELGLVGVALLTLAWLALRRGYQFDAMTSWQRAVWTGLFICALGSEDLLSLPVLALLASQLVPRTVAPSSLVP